MNEDSEADEDDELSKDGYMDISEMLGPSKPSSSRNSAPKSANNVEVDEEDESEDGSGGDSEEDDDEGEDSQDDDEDSVDSLDDDEEDPEALSRLGDLVNGLSSQSGIKRRKDDLEVPATENAKKRKRSALGNERTEAIPEGEFAATSNSKDGT